MSELARRAAERAARVSYGRLVAMLASRSRDIAGAEDALGDALLAALRTWPERGVPANTDAWLMTAARNAVVSAARRRGVRDAGQAELERIVLGAAPEDRPFLDERLKLMFVCAHPAIDAAVRTPLMLQTVLGLDAARIGAAFLVAPATMGQRLVRAKAKIRDAGVRFELPEPDCMDERLEDVLDAVYAAYGAGWDALGGPDARAQGLAEEAIYLGRLLVTLAPCEPEALGLLALMLYCEARRDARRDGEGRFVPLSRQDARLWSRPMIVEAEALLTRGSGFGRFGRFLCEAAIQSVHVQRPITGRTDHAALMTLYDMLAERQPSLGVLVARAAVMAEAGDGAAALAALDALPAAQVDGWQPWWIARARALEKTGEAQAAREALDRAIALTTDDSVRAFLIARRENGVDD